MGIIDAWRRLRGVETGLSIAVFTTNRLSLCGSVPDDCAMVLQVVLMLRLVLQPAAAAPIPQAVGVGGILQVGVADDPPALATLIITFDALSCGFNGRIRTTTRT